MEQTVLLVETKKVIHIGVKLLITLISIAHLILHGMRSCIILHNMIAEDERDTYAQYLTYYDQSEASGFSTPESFSTEVLPAYENHVRVRPMMRNSNVHHELVG